jgi:hypothetical protein
VEAFKSMLLEGEWTPEVKGGIKAFFGHPSTMSGKKGGGNIVTIDPIHPIQPWHRAHNLLFRPFCGG